MSSGQRVEQVRAGFYPRLRSVLSIFHQISFLSALLLGAFLVADSASAAPKFDVSPKMFPGRTVEQGGRDSVAVLVSNLGDMPLAYHMMVAPDDAGPAHVRVEGALDYINMLPPFSPPHTVHISYDAGPLPAAVLRNWRVMVTSNDPGNDTNVGGEPIDILLHVLITPSDSCTTCAVVDCGQSFSDPTLTACPGGDEAFSVYLRDAAGLPVAGSDDVWLDFSGCPSVIPCPSETTWPIVHPTALSGADGRAVFLVNAGGCNGGCMVQVHSSCGLIGLVPFKSFDTDGNLAVSPSDLTPDVCSDWDGSGDVRDLDVTLFMPHISHNCSVDARKQIRPRITLSPDAGVKTGDPVQVKLDIRNYTEGNVKIDSVVFFQSGYDVGAPRSRLPLQPAATDADLPSGSATEVITNYVVPPFHGPSAASEAKPLECVTAEIYTSAAVAPVECEHCEAVLRQSCTPDTAFEFRFYVPVIPVYYRPWVFMPTGFTANVNPDVELQFTQPDSVTADVTIDPPTATIGDSGRIFLLFCEDVACFQEVTQRIFRAIYVHQRGDVNDDCAITSADVILLVNYIFKSGAEPQPYPEIGNIDCLGGITAGDIVTLVNFVFRGGAPLLGDCP